MAVWSCLGFKNCVSSIFLLKYEELIHSAELQPNLTAVRQNDLILKFNFILLGAVVSCPQYLPLTAYISWVPHPGLAAHCTCQWQLETPGVYSLGHLPTVPVNDSLNLQGSTAWVIQV